MTQPIPQGYKQTEIGVIPEDWEVVSIENALKDSLLVDQMDGNHGELYPKSSEFTSDGVPYVGATDFFRGSINYKDCKYLSFQRASKFKKGIAKNGDVLFAHNATVGPVTIVETSLDFIVISTTATYYRCNKNKINNFYLASFFKSEAFVNQFSAVMSQSTRNQVPILTQRKFSLILPSLKEQTAIATALSDVDALISGLESLIAKKQAIKTATMQQLLTGKTRLPQFAHHPNGTAKGYQQTELGLVPEDWGVKSLGEVANINMGQSPSSSCYNNKSIGLPLVQGNADIFNRKTIIRNYTSQITKKAKKGDLILSVRAPVGEVAKADFDCCIGRGVCALQYKNDYLYHWLIGFETEWEKFSKGSTFDSINSDELRAIQLILPSDEEQVAIAQILSDMDSDIQALEARLSKTKQMKQGMMQVLLTGKVRLV